MTDWANEDMGSDYDNADVGYTVPFPPPLKPGSSLDDLDDTYASQLGICSQWQKLLAGTITLPMLTADDLPDHSISQSIECVREMRLVGKRIYKTETWRTALRVRYYYRVLHLAHDNLHSTRGCWTFCARSIGLASI